VFTCKSPKDHSNTTDNISIEAFACEGMCPVYSLTFYANGQGKYNGKYNVIKKGVHEINFEKEDIDSIFELVSTINFTELKAIYESPIADLPSLVISYKEKRIEVKDMRNVPEEFKVLITKLMTMARSTNFIE
jgi:hypothetical protein